MLPDKLEAFQGGATYPRWYKQITAMLPAQTADALTRTTAKGELTPDWGADVSPDQLRRLQKQDRRLYGLIPGALSTNKIAKESDFEATQLFTKLDNLSLIHI